MKLIKNICFFSGDITRGGGTERVASIIISQLYSIKKYNISIISLFEKLDKPSFSINENIERSVLFDRPVRALTNTHRIIYRLNKVIKSNKVDILIDIDGVLDLFSIPLKLFNNIKIISWEHFNFYYYNKKFPYRKYIRMLAGRFSDGIVTLTNEDKEYYKNNIKINCPITCIHNPIINTYPLDTTYNENSKVILSVGRLTYQKGFDMLVDVANYVLNKHTDWKWIILGDGEEKELLKRKITEYGLEENLLLQGNIKNVQDYYKSSSMLVLTSRFEGLPMILLEGMANKLPMLSFNIKTGPKECIINNRNGFLVDEFDLKEMSNKICKLIEDKDLRMDFSKHSLDNFNKFNLEKITDSWINLIENC